MKFKFLLWTTLGLASQIAFASGTDPDLCAEKTALLRNQGKTVMGCTQSYQGKALTADFQPKITGALTAKVTQVRGLDGSPGYLHALEKYYGIRGMKFYSTYQEPNDPDYGVTLLQKFASATATSYPNDTQTLSYIQNDLTKNNRAIRTNSATGSCLIWSAWSMDPEIQSLMANVHDGILCSGVPFTKAELKELITSVYPDPYRNSNLEVKALAGKYDPMNQTGIHNAVGGPAVEDANLSLARLGNFGEGSGFTPDGLIAMAQAAKAQGNPLIMDLDSGTSDVWNQPVEAIVDVSYLDNSMTKEEINSNLKAQDLLLNPAAGQTARDIVNQLAKVEAQLKYQAMTGTLYTVSPELKYLRAMSGESQIPFNPTSLMDQVAELKRIQQRFVDLNFVQIGQNAVVKHRVFIQYGDEAHMFAQNEDQPSLTREIDYVSVNGRASWSPPTKKLSSVCASPDKSLGTRVSIPGYGLVDSLDINSACSKFNQNHQDRDLAMGPFPPKTMNIYHLKPGDAKFGDLDQGKKDAYHHLKDMILSCDQGRGGSFHGAALFMDDLKATVSKNAISPTDVKRLKSEYLQVRDFLDDDSLPPEQNFVKQVIQDTLQGASGDASRVDGLNTLYHSLFG